MEVAKLLIKKGASLEGQNNNGESPLYVALLQRDACMASMFVECLREVNLAHLPLSSQVN